MELLKKLKKLVVTYVRICLSQAPAEIYNLEMTHGVNLFLIQKHLSLWTILR